ncbi:hypothetical protein Bbelb_031190 [Branchiostoma belcheri]|nr:hypothetical protein Bbelb_031190 [Branchiostoma belcheri]
MATENKRPTNLHAYLEDVLACTNAWLLLTNGADLDCPISFYSPPLVTACGDQRLYSRHPLRRKLRRMTPRLPLLRITTLPSQNPLGRLKKCKLADVDSDSPLFVDALGDQGIRLEPKNRKDRRHPVANLAARPSATSDNVNKHRIGNRLRS